MKTLWEKEKMLVTSIFSFSHNVFFSSHDKEFTLTVFNLSKFSCSFCFYSYHFLLFLQHFLRLERHIKFWIYHLKMHILYTAQLCQTTSFGLVQIESICRRKDKYNLKMEILFRMGRKHCRKRRKCWFPAFSPFPTMFSKGFFRGSLKVRLVCFRLN